jgi:hypothetical protein
MDEQRMQRVEIGGGDGAEPQPRGAQLERGGAQS